MTLRSAAGRIWLMVAMTLAATPAKVQAQPRIDVVATFTILADMVSAIGGDRVSVTSLVGPDADMHVYEPRPGDVRLVANADLVVFNGLGFEGWIDRLVEAAGYTGPKVVAAEGVEPREAGEAHDHGGPVGAAAEPESFDPHAWQDIANARLYVEAIARGLIVADPTGEAAYRTNLAAYLAELTAVEAEIVSLFAAIPPDRRSVITSHDAFGYFGAAYGIAFHAPQGLSTDAEPTAADVAALIRQIREDGAGAVFVEAITDGRLIGQIARETGAVVGGTLFSDALSPPDGLAPTYLAMMRHNAQTIATALMPRR